MVDQLSTANFASQLPSLLDAPKRNERFAPCLIGLNAGPNIFLSFAFNMIAQFLIQLGIEPPTANESAKSISKVAEHAISSYALSRT
jgi:hypothetical protein